MARGWGSGGRVLLGAAQQRARLGFRCGDQAQTGSQERRQSRDCVARGHREGERILTLWGEPLLQLWQAREELLGLLETELERCERIAAALGESAG